MDKAKLIEKIREKLHYELSGREDAMVYITKEEADLILTSLTAPVDGKVTDEISEPYFGWCDVEGCSRASCCNGLAWKYTGYWKVCDIHADQERQGMPPLQMKQSAINREKRRGIDGTLAPEVNEHIIHINASDEFLKDPDNIKMINKMVKNAIDMENETFTKQDLVSFGNYLLSTERTKLIEEAPYHSPVLFNQRLQTVSDADLANWKESITNP